MTKDQQNLVQDLLAQDVGNLNDWAIGFLQNLENSYWSLDYKLSKKQIDKLNGLAKQEGLIE